MSLFFTSSFNETAIAWGKKNLCNPEDPFLFEAQTMNFCFAACQNCLLLLKIGVKRVLFWLTERGNYSFLSERLSGRRRRLIVVFQFNRVSFLGDLRANVYFSFLTNIA